MLGNGRNESVHALLASSALATFILSPALAADVQDYGRIETVTVTAEKRVTPLQTTAVAATVFSQESIESNHIVNFQDLAISVPNLTYTQFSTQENYFSIRGTLINNNGAGWDDAVTTFVDGVPTTGLGDQDPDLFDLTSIEVLRGPQGTLFGRNVTGGAIVIHTLEPSFDFGGKAEITYGAFGMVQARGLVTGPINDDVAAKVSVDYNYKNDYIPNVTLHDKTAGTNQLNGRAQVLWRPSNDLEFLFGADILYDNSGGYPTKLIGNFQPSLFPNLSYSPDRTNQAFNGFNHRDIFGLMARATWTTDMGVLTSTTGYRNVNDHFPNSLLGDPENQLLALGIVQDKQLTEELNYASPIEGPLTWVAGLFYLHSNKREANPLFFNVDPNTQVGAAFSGPPPLTETFNQITDQHILTDSYAVYGEAAYAFLSYFKLTAGARETWERKGGQSVVFYTNSPSPNPNFMFPGDANYHRWWNAFTPKAQLSYQPNDDLFLYASAIRGFKSGGYDLSAAGAGEASSADVSALLAVPFEPETVWSFETGEKWTGFDNRIVVDGDAFLAEYKKLQTSQLVIAPSGVPVMITTNAPGVTTVQGFELESTGIATDWLTVGATYAYMDAHFDQADRAVTGFGRIPYAPMHQVHLSAEVHFDVPEIEGRVAAAADYTFHSKAFFNNANNQPGFIIRRSVWNDIINAHVEYASDDTLWRVSLWGKNLAGDRPLLHAADVSVFFDTLAESGSVLLAKYYPERTWGLTLTRNF